MSVVMEDFAEEEEVKYVAAEQEEDFRSQQQHRCVRLRLSHPHRPKGSQSHHQPHHMRMGRSVLCQRKLDE